MFITCSYLSAGGEEPPLGKTKIRFFLKPHSFKQYHKVRDIQPNSEQKFIIDSELLEGKSDQSLVIVDPAACIESFDVGVGGKPLIEVFRQNVVEEASGERVEMNGERFDKDLWYRLKENDPRWVTSQLSKSSLIQKKLNWNIKENKSLSIWTSSTVTLVNLRVFFGGKEKIIEFLYPDFENGAYRINLLEVVPIGLEGYIREIYVFTERGKEFSWISITLEKLNFYNSFKAKYDLNERVIQIDVAPFLRKLHGVAKFKQYVLKVKTKCKDSQVPTMHLQDSFNVRTIAPVLKNWRRYVALYNPVIMNGLGLQFRDLPKCLSQNNDDLISACLDFRIDKSVEIQNDRYKIEALYNKAEETVSVPLRLLASLDYLKLKYAQSRFYEIDFVELNNHRWVSVRLSPVDFPFELRFVCNDGFNRREINFKDFPLMKVRTPEAYWYPLLSLGKDTLRAYLDPSQSNFDFHILEGSPSLIVCPTAVKTILVVQHVGSIKDELKYVLGKVVDMRPEFDFSRLPVAIDVTVDSEFSQQLSSTSALDDLNGRILENDSFEVISQRNFRVN